MGKFTYGRFIAEIFTANNFHTYELGCFCANHIDFFNPYSD